MTVAFFLLGLLLGFFSFVGLLGLIEALIVLGLVLFRVRRFPERAGAYLFGMSLPPLSFLWAIISTEPACRQHAPLIHCYPPLFPVALVAYALGGLAGAALLGVSLRRMFGVSTTSSSM